MFIPTSPRSGPAADESYVSSLQMTILDGNFIYFMLEVLEYFSTKLGRQSQHLDSKELRNHLWSCLIDLMFIICYT